jgi:hypothetical protein
LKTFLKNEGPSGSPFCILMVRIGLEWRVGEKGREEEKEKDVYFLTRYLIHSDTDLQWP